MHEISVSFSASREKVLSRLAMISAHPYSAPLFQSRMRYHYIEAWNEDGESTVRALIEGSLSEVRAMVAQNYGEEYALTFSCEVSAWLSSLLAQLEPNAPITMTADQLRVLILNLLLEGHDLMQRKLEESN